MIVLEWIFPPELKQGFVFPKLHAGLIEANLVYMSWQEWGIFSVTAFLVVPSFELRSSSSPVLDLSSEVIVFHVT